MSIYQLMTEKSERDTAVAFAMKLSFVDPRKSVEKLRRELNMDLLRFIPEAALAAKYGLITVDQNREGFQSLKLSDRGRMVVKQQHERHAKLRARQNRPSVVKRVIQSLR